MLYSKAVPASENTINPANTPFQSRINRQAGFIDEYLSLDIFKVDSMAPPTCWRANYSTYLSRGHTPMPTSRRSLASMSWNEGRCSTKWRVSESGFANIKDPLFINHLLCRRSSRRYTGAVRGAPQGSVGRAGGLHGGVQRGRAGRYGVLCDRLSRRIHGPSRHVRC